MALPENTRILLSACAEAKSSGQRAGRKGDAALFADHGGLRMYLVACHTMTPQGVVTTLRDDMVLYRLGPYEDGLSLVYRATPEQVTHYRARIAEFDRRREQKEHGQLVIRSLLDDLHKIVQTRIESCPEVTDRDDAAYVFRDANREPSLEDIATACTALHISLRDCIAEAVQ
jgi:hypothetical protein